MIFDRLRSLLSKSPFSLLKTKSESDIIPTNSPWIYRWSFPGLRTIYRFLRLNKELQLAGNKDDTVEIERANEKFLAAQFACRFGSACDPSIRNLADLALKKKIATQSELRSIIEYGDIHKIGDKIEVKPNAFAAFLGAVQIALIVLYTFVILTIIISTITNIFIILFGLLFFTGICVFFSYTFYYSTLRPYFAAKKVKTKLESLFLESQNITNRMRYLPD